MKANWYQTHCIPFSVKITILQQSLDGVKTIVWQTFNLALCESSGQNKTGGWFHPPVSSLSIVEYYLRCDVNNFLVASLVGKFDNAGYHRIKRVIAADTDIASRKHFGAALTHDDRAGKYRLTTKAFDTAPLGIRVAPVL